MRSDPEFRQATEAEFPQLAELRWAARAEGNGEIPVVTREEFLSACTRFFKKSQVDGSHFFFIVAQNDLAIAHLSVHRVRLFPRPAKLDDYMGIITENYTRSDYRNRGIGGRLLEYVIDWAQEQDFELLIVYPSERAVPFYARAGFCSETEVMELRLREYYSPGWSEQS
jgi:GNAT superfamily N-acetyltransferase